MTLFDTHAHYTDNAFNRDRTELLGQLLPAAGVAAAVTAGVDVESSRASVALAEAYDYIYAAAGI
ncbi:MAG: hydrolase TatD, partial [Oscillibacter sp.]|nr:hydrolase TatD [Oscillibacter sp.]